MQDHQYYMRLALTEAGKAYESGEVPVGAVIVADDGTILGKAHNQTLTRHDPTAHAEILALRQAAEYLKNYRLNQTKLYVTIEPCMMCAGALIHARVDEIIFGTPDPKWGALISLYHLGEDVRLNHQLQVIQGVLETECREIIQRFFQEKRAIQKQAPLPSSPSIVGI